MNLDEQHCTSIATALIIFGALFVVSGVFLIVHQCLGYRYWAKLVNDVEKRMTSSKVAPEVLRCCSRETAREVVRSTRPFLTLKPPV